MATSGQFQHKRIKTSPSVMPSVPVLQAQSFRTFAPPASTLASGYTPSSGRRGQLEQAARFGYSIAHLAIHSPISSAVNTSSHPLQSGATVQRKIDYGDAQGVSKREGRDEWLDEYHKAMESRMESLEAYKPFYRLEGRTIHIDIENRNKDYFQEIQKLFSNNKNLELDAHTLKQDFPHVLISETTKTEVRNEDQIITFFDADVTPEEQEITPLRVQKVQFLVHEAKLRIQDVMDVLKLIDSKEKESQEFIAALQTTLKASDEETPIILKTLGNIFWLIQNRLSQKDLEISTMNRKTTLADKKTLGNSSPPRGGDWLIKQKDDVLGAKWQDDLLNKRQDFGGIVRMRLDANDLVYHGAQSQLLNTLIHELSHAAAATHDFAYLDVKEYEGLDWIERLGNADTIALIAEQLSSMLREKQVAASPLREKQAAASPFTELKEKEVDSSAPVPQIPTQEIKRQILELSKQITSNEVLKVKIFALLERYQMTWNDIEGEFAFDGDEERVAFLML